MSNKSVSINTLTYNNSIVGYRVVLNAPNTATQYYDMNIGVAEKYKLAKGMCGIEIPLITHDGLLLSKQEMDYGITVKDISTNLAFLKELSGLRSTKHSAEYLRKKAEVDRQKALQMDRYNRLLQICLNRVNMPVFNIKHNGYTFIVADLSIEIDKVLVSQGVFTADTSLNKKLSKGVVDAFKHHKYKYVDVMEYKKKGKSNQTLDMVLSNYNTRDIFMRK